jgi:hypothetical protein
MYVEPSSAATIVTFQKASVYLAVTEDFGRTNMKDTPYVYVAGGISAGATYGLGMYNALLISVSMDGVLYNNGNVSNRDILGAVEGAVAHPNAA